MADDHRTLLNRAAALLAGPFLLGQRALSQVLTGKLEPTLVEVPVRIPVPPPEHAIKRRG